jgi:pyridinium-3,5-biscarboxylic acid mononucleotide sulfurtransferase
MDRRKEIFSGKTNYPNSRKIKEMPGKSAQSELQKKIITLKKQLQKTSKMAIAFSGGIDSTFLLKKAYQENSNTIAITACSELIPEREIQQTKKICNQIGAKQIIVKISPLLWSEFTKNDPQRCYHCKKRIYTLFFEALNAYKSVLLDGTNFDDLKKDRPGKKALKELKIISPLAEAELSKPEIRFLSKKLELDNWNLPSASCLATRVPTGIEITSQRLVIIKDCEDYLATLGLSGTRVKINNNQAVIELTGKDMIKIIPATVRNKIFNKFNKFNISSISLNLREREDIILPQRA